MLMDFKLYVNIASLCEILLFAYYVGVADIGGLGLDRMFHRQKAFSSVETSMYFKP